MSYKFFPRSSLVASDGWKASHQIYSLRLVHGFTKGKQSDCPLYFPPPQQPIDAYLKPASPQALNISEQTLNLTLHTLLLLAVQISWRARLNDQNGGEGLGSYLYNSFTFTRLRQGVQWKGLSWYKLAIHMVFRMSLYGSDKPQP